MKITKLEHSGVVLEKNGKQLIFDPVEFTEKLPDFDNVAAIILTHKHGDHFQPEIIERILEQNPEARVFAPTDFDINEIAGHPIEKVEAEVIWELPDFHLHFFGHDHASIIPGVVPCRNLGVVVDETVVNPGDSFDFPDFVTRPKVLFVPSAAPWCKISESMDYIVNAKPEIAVPFHDAVSSDLGNGFNNTWLATTEEPAGTKLTPLKPGESIEIK